MSRKKGLSKDEKLIGMQELMMESKDIWTLKELEKECPRKKGITSMSVKEVLQELCDNDLVSFEKIGSGNFYWCFPSEACNRRKVLEQKLLGKISELESEIDKLTNEITELEPGREDSEERNQLDNEISEISRKLEDVRTEAGKYEKLNPQGLKAMKEDTKVALEAANRWTDNIFQLRSYITKQFNVDRKDFDEHFNIPEEFDYVE